MLRAAGLGLLAFGLAACAGYPTPTVAVRPTPLPTRSERITPTAEPTVSLSPRPTSPPPLTAVVGDPYAALYVSEREGQYVTSRRADARYYYRWDDRRWYAVADRVWFRDVEDLKTVFPNRVPAP